MDESGDGGHIGPVKFVHWRSRTGEHAGSQFSSALVELPGVRNAHEAADTIEQRMLARG